MASASRDWINEFALTHEQKKQLKMNVRLLDEVFKEVSNDNGSKDLAVTSTNAILSFLVNTIAMLQILGLEREDVFITAVLMMVIPGHDVRDLISRVQAVGREKGYSEAGKEELDPESDWELVHASKS